MPSKPLHSNGGAPPPEPEQLPCPRCDSTNTKFCYYNNYNFSQPRHFCKGCRRYWTHGGALRDIPVGGGTRKSAKRSRTDTSSPISAVTAASPVMFHGGGLPMCGGGGGGSFTSLLGAQGPVFTGLGGFGLGPGFEDLGFGMRRAVWPFQGVGDGATWQMQGGEGGGFNAGGECFTLPELAISSPGNCLK